MATVSDASADEVRRLNLESERIEAETRKLLAEANKLSAEQYKLSAERSKLETDRSVAPWLLLAQGLIAGAALLGAGAALSTLFIG